MTLKKTLFFTFVIYALLLIGCRSNNGTNETTYDYVPSQPDKERDYPLETVSGKTAIDYFRRKKYFPA